jgi:hypothetical protein
MTVSIGDAHMGGGSFNESPSFMHGLPGGSKIPNRYDPGHC